MGFWDSFKNQMGRNTGWVVSNWIYGDKAARRFKGSVTYENKNPSPKTDTEEDIRREVTENSASTGKQNGSNQYTEYDLIPFISIGNDTASIDENLEKLVQYAKITPLDSGNSVELLKAYSNKIDEGIRKLKRINIDGSTNDDITYWELELNQINENLQKAIKIDKRENNPGCFSWLILFFYAGFKYLLIIGIIILIVLFIASKT